MTEDGSSFHRNHMLPKDILPATLVCCCVRVISLFRFCTEMTVPLSIHRADSISNPKTKDVPMKGICCTPSGPIQKASTRCSLWTSSGVCLCVSDQYMHRCYYGENKNKKCFVFLGNIMEKKLEFTLPGWASTQLC